MSNWRQVTPEEFQQFLRDYPRPLQRGLTTICEPPLLEFNDYQRAPYWPDSVVASVTADHDGTQRNHRVLADINAPVEDDGRRRAQEPLLDSDGVVLQEGDLVNVLWGTGPANTTRFGRSYNQHGQCIKQERIVVRDRDTKYEHWSFESCHNNASGFTMRLIARKDGVHNDNT